MNQEIIQLHDLIRMVKRNRWLLVLTVTLCTVISVAAAFLVPPKFQAEAVLNIQSAYFQTAMVGNVITQVRDPGELKSQRNALLRLAMNDEFIDTLAEKHGVYEYPAGHEMRAVEREHFKKGIRYFSLGSTSFQIQAGGKSAAQAYEITRAVLDQMINTLISERRKTLTKTRDVILGNLQSLGVTIKGFKEGLTDEDTEFLKESLRRKDREVGQLKRKYTPKHPSVQKAEREAAEIREQLEILGKGGEIPARVEDAKVDVNTGSKKASTELYEDLLKKLNYLNIVLEMEKDPKNVDYLTVVEEPKVPPKPYFPKKRVFVGVGFAAGIVLALVLVFFVELRRGSFLSPTRASELLGAPLLGEMPVFPRGEELLRIEDLSGAGSRPQIELQPSGAEEPEVKKKKKKNGRSRDESPGGTRE